MHAFVVQILVDLLCFVLILFVNSIVKNTLTTIRVHVTNTRLIIEIEKSFLYLYILLIYISYNSIYSNI